MTRPISASIIVKGIQVKYHKLIIYYFSGTGNARNAAGWIREVAEENGMETHVVNIDKHEKINLIDFSEKCIIGICFPTHGFNLPPIVLRFIRKFPKVKNTDAFIMNTRAGMKLNKLFLPGISGSAQMLPALILRLKGFRIVGMQPLDLPSNWLLIHPGLKTKVVISIHHRCKRIVRHFSSKLFSGQPGYKALRSLPLDIALLPITISYYIFGRFFLAKTLVATDGCNNCEKCIRQCPVKAITMVNERPFWTYNCESCMRCINACPQRAIETAHAFSASLFVISSLVISPALIVLLKYVKVWPLITHSALTENIWILVYTSIFLMFVFISYRILHYLMRYKWINKIVAYTSLSKYKFWRRYKAPKNI